MAFRMTLGKRVGSGIVMMLFLMLAVGFGGWFGLTRVLGVVRLYEAVSSVQLTVSTAKEKTGEFLIANLAGDQTLRQFHAPPAQFGRLAMRLFPIPRFRSRGLSLRSMP